jgi:hypothetical protein
MLAALFVANVKNINFEIYLNCMKHIKLNNALLAILSVFLLSACGGGGDSKGGVTSSTPIADMFSVISYTRVDNNTRAELTIDKSESNWKANLRDTGVRIETGITGIRNGRHWDGSLLNVALFESWNTNNPLFVGSSGLVQASGGVIVSCSAGALQNASLDTVATLKSQQGLIAYLASYEPIQLNELAGKIFTGFDCAGSYLKNTYNSDGTITHVDISGTTIYTQAQAKTMFTPTDLGGRTSGFVTSDGHWYVYGGYKLNTSSGVKYIIVSYVDWDLPSKRMRIFY